MGLRKKKISVSSEQQRKESVSYCYSNSDSTKQSPPKMFKKKLAEKLTNEISAKTFENDPNIQGNTYQTPEFEVSDVVCDETRSK